MQLSLGVKFYSQRVLGHVAAAAGSVMASRRELLQAGRRYPAPQLWGRFRQDPEKQGVTCAHLFAGY